MEKTQSTSGSFGYHGEVTIKLKKGRQIQTLPKSSNQGLPYLFNGLCKVMAGENSIKEIVPARVALYSKTSSEDAVFDGYIPATVLCPFETAMFDGQKTIIQGKIPFGNITQNTVNALALYPIVAENARDSADKALAFYTLDTEVAIDRTSLDDSFIFEWYMEFGNAELKEESR